MQRAAAITALFVSTSLASLWPLLAREGWPASHEWLAFQFRTSVYAFAHAQGDLLPIWSSEDFHGLGTPMPFFYHKLFYALSGSLYWAVGSMKGALVGSLLLLLVAGCLGLHRALLRLDVPFWGAAAVAATFPFQAYTLCDWLIRGAMAELAGCALVPWVLFSVLTAIRERRFPWHLPLSLFLLALAHSVIAWFAAWIALLGLGFAYAGASRAQLRAEARRAALHGAAWLAAVSPLLLVYARLRRHYDVGGITTGLYEPTRHFRGFVAGQIWGESWRWGATERWTPTALNPETLVFLGVAAIGIGWQARRLGRRWFGEERAVVFLLVALLLCVFLQLSVSAPLYELLPGLRFVQFPWRLLAVEQVLVLALVGCGLARLALPRERPWVRALPFALLAAAVVGNRSFHPIEYPYFPPAALEEIAAPGTSEGVPGSHGEYLPVVEPREPPTGPAGRLALYQLGVGHPEAELERAVTFVPLEARASCSGGAVPRERFEQRELRYRVQCAAPATAVLRHHFSGLERVFLRGDGEWQRADVHRTAGDPRIRVRVPAGTTRIRVAVPRLWHAFLP